MLLDMPSGLQVEADKIKGKHAIRMAEKARSVVGTPYGLLIEVLAACTTSIVSPGPYPWIQEGAASLEWKRTVTADILVGVFQLRAGSFRRGGKYTFRVDCGMCEKPFPWTLDLLDLPVKKIPEESRKILAADGMHPLKLEDGRLVQFRLPTAQDDEPLRRFLKTLKPPRKELSQVERAAISVREIEGLKPKPDLATRHAFFEELALDDCNDVVAAINKASGGVDTRIYARCDKCRTPRQVDLPFVGSFFYPQEEETPEAMGLEEEPTTPEETTGS